MTDIIRVGVAGVRGYKGHQLARLLAAHPHFRIAMVASDVMAGSRLSELDQELIRDGAARAVGYSDTVLAADDYGVDVMFLATQVQRSAELAVGLIKNEVRVVDLSGAHCIYDPEQHLQAYGFEQNRFADTVKIVRSLPEFSSHPALRVAQLAANPTSYATIILLSLLPLIQKKAIDHRDIVVDIKSGSSSSGRKAKVSLLFSEVAENIQPAVIERQQHSIEILQALTAAAAAEIQLTLVKHTIPIRRGIFTTSYIKPKNTNMQQALMDVTKLLHETYANHPFVRVVEHIGEVQLEPVIGTNRCLIGVGVDRIGKRLILASAIDNLLKGTSGQAIQLANLMYGFDETTALKLAVGARP